MRMDDFVAKKILQYTEAIMGEICAEYVCTKETYRDLELEVERNLERMVSEL